MTSIDPLRTQQRFSFFFGGILTFWNFFKDFWRVSSNDQQPTTTECPWNHLKFYNSNDNNDDI